MIKPLFKLFFLSILFLLAGCGADQSIVSSIDERDANEIVVFLASKGIIARKMAAATSAIGGEGGADLYNIDVDKAQATNAMALLNQYGLPRRQGTDLLTLFAKGGLISSDREETIRYQAGLSVQLANTIRKFDGVLDANVQISFPPTETTPMPGVTPPKTTAAVYVKHQGVMEDPNSHIEVKIKRLLAGSINGLNFDDVAVIADRSRLADIRLQANGEMIGPKALAQTYVSIWGVTLTKSSLTRFRVIFFLFTTLLLAFAGALGWMVYKFYPLMKFKKEKPEETPPPGL